MTIVMGLDQHRGQITGEWFDTETGELQRTRVAPADRAHVRSWLSRFRGKELEVALEATTGWRFVVEELRVGGHSLLRARNILVAISADRLIVSKIPVDIA